MYLITNRHLCQQDRYLDILKESSYFGIENIVLREKDLSDIELEKLYYKVRKIIKPTSKIIINNNIEVFNKVDAYGLHLSFNTFINYYDKRLLPSDKVIGVSTHSIEEIIEVKKRKASYIFLSHIYETKCKKNLKPKGIEILIIAKKILAESNIKLVALGGILPSNVLEVLNYCDDIAIMSPIMTSLNVKSTIENYLV